MTNPELARSASPQSPSNAIPVANQVVSLTIDPVVNPHPFAFMLQDPHPWLTNYRYHQTMLAYHTAELAMIIQNHGPDLPPEVNLPITIEVGSNEVVIEVNAPVIDVVPDPSDNLPDPPGIHVNDLQNA